jgi:hypothetical protein
VISVIVYGRNDAHGYNLHRRVALSLNCIAEVLTDPDDEIVFVDYNTPDELPTLIEALSDTLTDRCLKVLRVLRVRPALHKERFAPRTHLSVAEPVARNAAARRANPSNRWLLSTNTDMVFLGLGHGSLSEICGEIADGFYALPRYELPEWLWEQLPRTDPQSALAELAKLGTELRLDEATVSHDWIRFDAPGDFQLMLRDDFAAVDGFHEEMLLGYHVDSNLSRRMLLHRGSIQSLGDQVAGYHCNHNRIPTVYHDARPVTNDLERFFFSVKEAKIGAQRHRWGLADAVLEEVQVREPAGTSFRAAVVDAIPAGGPSTPSDAFGDPFALSYDSGHVLPFVADSLVVAPREAKIAYIGANPVLERMLSRLVDTLQLGRPLAVVDKPDSVRDLHDTTDVFVVDLGVDVCLAEGEGDQDRDAGLRALRERLYPAFESLQLLVELERHRVGRGMHPRCIVLVNSGSAYWNAYVLAQLDCSYATIHSRVRRATVKLVPDEAPAVEVVAPYVGGDTLSPWEEAVIDVYRRRPAFRAILASTITVATLMARAGRLGRRVDPPAELEVISAMITAGFVRPPLEPTLITMYRRGRIFRAFVVYLLRAGAATTGAARLGRPPRRVLDPTRAVPNEPGPPSDVRVDSG